MNRLYRSRGSRSAVVGWVLVAAAAVAVAFWAGRATLVAPEPVVANTARVLYTVQEDTVGRVQSFSAEAEWRTRPVSYQSGSGTVTSIDTPPGAMVDVGARLFGVDLRPVLAAEGVVPAFRELSQNDTGTDVEQLERFLATIGFFDGEVDGDFSATTETAVRAWQESWGLEEDGVVRPADLVFLPDLPARVALSAELRVGKQLQPGEPAVSVVADAPTFTVTLGQEQADLVPLVTTVEVHHATGSWSGHIFSATTDEQGELVLTLAGQDRAPLCGQECALVPVGETSVYRTDLVVTPSTTGPVVPLSALRTHPDGSVSVVDSEGNEVSVTVTAAAQGRAVVEGLDVGAQIQLVGEDAVEDGTGDPAPEPPPGAATLSPAAFATTRATARIS